jgi:hypothetical protein
LATGRSVSMSLIPRGECQGAGNCAGSFLATLTQVLFFFVRVEALGMREGVLKYASRLRLVAELPQELTVRHFAPQ